MAAAVKPAMDRDREMYWSNNDIARYREMIASCGFQLLAEATLSNGYTDDGLPAELHSVVFAQRL